MRVTNLDRVASTKNPTEEDTVMLEEINIIAVVPAGTICIEENVTGVGEDNKTWRVTRLQRIKEIVRGYTDLRFCQEGYFRDHMDLLPDDADQWPLIMKIPAEAVRLELVCVVHDDEGQILEETIRMTPGDLYQARAEFLKYIPDGDDFDARYSYVFDDEEKGNTDAE